MATDVGIKVKVDGEASFKTAIKGIETQIKALNAEMKAAVSGMDSMQSSEESTSQKTKILTDTISKNREKLALLSEQYDKAKSKLTQLGQAYDTAKANNEENSTEVTKAANAYNRQAQEVAKLETQMNLANAAINTATSEMEELRLASSKALIQVGESVSEMGSKIKSVGTTLTKYVTTPTLAAGTAAVKFASDYTENINKVDVAFEDSADTVKEWAKTATENFGLSENAALEAAALFGDLGTSMGLTREAAAEMAITLTGLAGDLASFKNMDIDQVMTGLKGIFTGETESIKELGVVMTETNLKEFASDLGLVYDEMSQAEKVTLRYQYVLEKTTNAQGDYVRTGDDLANSLRTAKAEAENLAVAFGEEILPSVTPLIQEATELIRKFGELDEGTKQNIIQAGLFAAAIGPVTTALGTATDGVGILIKKVGEGAGTLKTFSSALSGGSGVGSALVSTLGTGGTIGLAVAGMGALTAATIAVSNKIYDAIDPINGLQESMEDLEAAQESLSNAENVISLADKYQTLRTQMQDSSLTGEELSAVQQELDSTRQALSDATNGAISVEGDYTQALDNTVEKQKELAEAERNRSNAEIYAELVSSSGDYQKALEDEIISTRELEQQQRYLSSAEDDLVDASANAAAEMENQGKVSIRTKVDLANASSSVKGYSGSVEDLTEEIEENRAVIEDHEKGIVSLVNNGYITASEAAAHLGMSEDELKGIIEKYANTTDDATESTEGLEDAATDTSDALDEEAEAADNTASKIMDVAYAAVEARTSGGDLRAAYEELSSQLDTLRESGDERLIQLAEEKLELLNVAATTQELAAEYGNMAELIGVSTEEVAGYLIAADMSFEDFQASVESATSSVINNFDLASTSLGISIQEMGENLIANIQAQSEWNDNIASLWNRAVETGNSGAMAFVQALYDMGIQGAEQVSQFVNLTDEELAWWAELFNSASAEATENATIGAAMASESLYNSGVDMANSQLEGYESVDTTPSGEESTKNIIDGSNSQSSSVTSAATTQANLVVTAWNSRSAEFRNVGLTTSKTIAGGISSGSGTVSSAALSLAQAAKSAAGSISFYSVGYAMAQGIANGLYGGSSVIRSAAISVAQRALSAAKSELGINSPSRVFRDEVGEMIGAGIAEGMELSIADIKKAANLLGDTAYTTAQSVIAPIQVGGRASGGSQYTVSPTIYVYGAPGQDENVLAEKIMAKINTNLIRRSMS